MGTFEVGAIVATNEYFKVVASDSNGTLIEDNKGKKFLINNQEAFDKFVSSDNYDSTKKMTKTALVEEFMNIGDKPFCAEFETKEGHRVLRGYRLGRVNPFGYSDVIDLEASDSGFRKLNHNTLKSFICNNVKYQLK